MKKNIVIAVLCVACAVLGYLAFREKPVPDNTYLHKHVRDLEQQNVQLAQEIAAEREKTTKSYKIIDSLQHRKQDVKKEFYAKFETINSADANDMVAEFTTIFAANHIK